MEYEEEQYDTRMLIEDLDDPSNVLTEEQWKALTPAEQAEYEAVDDVTQHASLPASADPGQPLSAAPAMKAALDKIAIGAPASRTRPNERGPTVHKPEPNLYVNEDDEQMMNLSAEPKFTIEDVDALRTENLELKVENDSLRALMGDQNKKIRKLADDLRRARRERDEISQVAQKMKHQQELKPKQIQRALNAISKTLK